MTVSKIARVAVVGVGWWACRLHLVALRENPDAVVVALCDRDRNRVDEAARIFDVPLAVTDVGAVIDAGVDCAIVATPHDAHWEPAAALLDAGIDVLVEKPMTLDPGQAWDLVARARRTGARLHVGYPFLHSPHVARLRQVLHAGELGVPVLSQGLFATGIHRLLAGDVSSQLEHGGLFASAPSTYSDPLRGGGQMNNQMTHAVAVLLSATGLHAVSVSAYSNFAGLRVDLADSLAIEMSDGSVATIATTGSVQSHSSRIEEYRFFASEGHACLDTVHGSLEIARGGQPLTAEPTLTEAQANPEKATSIALVAAAIDPDRACTLAAPGEIGADVVALLAAASESAVAGKPVQAFRPPRSA
ncbi:Gfo/Idh/MocA family protein [Nakamurella sp. PAMC28650]|uniref:Gfo/Idh/MocA family protein n=1 Tax=Nakamurella sp. PAMC28650 TaxID=2762325 RepID=UPI00164D0881|nr:Gfo/Idh/MocA family oxidoreductase [Nakamurella sp. PAMC28650]QNK83283.1 Gfo/Idh/MocA family oxidoreductase [Nakamurella sp. PAMC28650]